MSKDILVRGISDEAVEYLEEYRTRGRCWQKKSWSVLIASILCDWVAEQKKKDQAREDDIKR